LTTDTSAQNNFRGNHSIGARFEQMIDSSNTLIVKANIRAGMRNDVNDMNQRNLTEAGVLRTSSEIINSSNFTNLNLTTNAIFRHKFKTKGRSFAVSLGYNIINSNGTEDLNSVNRFRDAQTFNEQVRAINQLNDNDNRQNILKGSLLYTEPLSKKIFWETFYNGSSDKRSVNRQSFDGLQETRRFDSLSTYFENTITYNRVGTSFRYSHSGVNILVGAAALRYDLEGSQFSQKGTVILSTINKNYPAFTPYIDASLELKNNLYFNLSYGLEVNAPRIADLQPVINNNNPFFISTGNPDLSPEKNHNFSFSLNKFDPATFMSINLWGGYDYYLSQVVYNQIVNPTTFVTNTRPENLSGGTRLYIGTYCSFPIVKTKLTVNFNPNINTSNNPTFINGVLNDNNNQNYQLRFGFSLTPSDKLIVGMNANVGINNIKFSLSEAQNQNIRNNSFDTSIKWNFMKKTFFETNLDYSYYKNERFGFEQEIPIFNASIRRLLMKENKLEVRLAAFDIFNKRQNIVQRGFQNTVTTQQALTLARYFMLSFTYNVKGHVDKLKKNQGWM
jgi:Outer membrane protein beta-barrel family